MCLMLCREYMQTAEIYGGKKTHLRLNDFLHFAEQCGIARTAAEKIIKKVLAAEEDYFNLCDESYLPQDMKDTLKELIHTRCTRLKG